MPKVSLYLPDGLWEAAQRRKDVNWSRVFQQSVKEALFPASGNARIPRIEQPDLDAKVDLVALRQRYAEERATLYRRGYEMGITAAQNMSYALMRYYEKIAWDPAGIRWSLHDEGIEDEFHAAALEKVPMPHSNPPLQDPGVLGAADVIAEGFADALRRVWERAMAVDEGSRQDNSETDQPSRANVGEGAER
jgi:hypothetical protein